MSWHLQNNCSERVEASTTKPRFLIIFTVCVRMCCASAYALALPTNECPRMEYMSKLEWLKRILWNDDSKLANKVIIMPLNNESNTFVFIDQTLNLEFCTGQECFTHWNLYKPLKFYRSRNLVAIGMWSEERLSEGSATSFTSSSSISSNSDTTYEFVSVWSM